MLYEKPMWVWKNAQYKCILVDLNNGIMISGNGHDTSPLKTVIITLMWESYFVLLFIFLQFSYSMKQGRDVELGNWENISAIVIFGDFCHYFG